MANEKRDLYPTRQNFPLLDGTEKMIIFKVQTYVTLQILTHFFRSLYQRKDKP